MGAKQHIQDFVNQLDNSSLDKDSKQVLAQGLFDKLQAVDLKSLIGDVTTQMPESDKKDVAQTAVSNLPDTDKANVVKTALENLPEQARTDVVRSIAPTLAAPVGKTLNRLWIIIVSTFSLVLVATVGALILTMFRSPTDGGTKPELILAIITSVIGFLAGLVSPSPTQTVNAATR